MNLDYKVELTFDTWQSFATIGRRSRCKKRKEKKERKNEEKRKELTSAVKHKTAENYRSGRPNKYRQQ